VSIVKLDDFEIYNLAINLGEEIYSLVESWKYFDKDTIGKQLVRSMDSVSANLSEGLGRFHYKEQKNFTYYARGSLFETRTWLDKSFKRNLIDEHTYAKIDADLNVLGIKLNNYLKTLCLKK
jgi:four helix bundle protein